jgi:uncharacterized protein YcgI (DUF1989 family)
LNIHIEPQSGVALLLRRGQTLRVIDPVGEQVSDIVAFALDDPAEWLSSGRTLDYNSTLLLTAGHILYSNRSRPMFTITADTVGRHDFTLAPCSPEMFRLLHGYEGEHPSCFANLARALALHGIPADAIPVAFNAFMNVQFEPDGRLSVEPPLSRAGDHIDLRAEMDLIVGATACSAEQSNNGAFKPIDLVVSDG